MNNKSLLQSIILILRGRNVGLFKWAFAIYDSVKCFWKCISVPDAIFVVTGFIPTLVFKKGQFLRRCKYFSFKMLWLDNSILKFAMLKIFVKNLTSVSISWYFQLFMYNQICSIFRGLDIQWLSEKWSPYFLLAKMSST